MNKAALARLLNLLHRLEDTLLALSLGALLLLSLLQIVLRAGFEASLPWGETLSRAGVLWLAMMGALGAARQQRHIAIDALPRFVSPPLWRLLHVLGQLGAAAICVWAAWLGLGLMLDERAFPLPFVLGIPSWVPMLVLPLGFGLLALRFTVSAFARRQSPEGAA